MKIVFIFLKKHMTLDYYDKFSQEEKDKYKWHINEMGLSLDIVRKVYKEELDYILGLSSITSDVDILAGSKNGD